MNVMALLEYLDEELSKSASVPLTGFGYTLAMGVREAVQKDGLLGVLTGGITGAAGGITAAVAAGLLCALFSRSGAKS